MKKWPRKAAAVCAGLVIGPGACGWPGVGRESVFESGRETAENNRETESQGTAENNRETGNSETGDTRESGSHVLEFRMAEGDEEKNFTLPAVGYSEHD